MIGRGLFVLTMLSNCVLSLPLITGQLENEDVKLTKCIVEALTEVISRPHPLPVSQECLVKLKTDDRIVSILHHQNFLKELQEIALQGHKERAQLQIDAGIPDPTTSTLQTADRSMVEALGGPGERSILSQKSMTRYGNGGGEKDDSLGDEASQEAADNAEEEEVKREDDKKTRGHIFESGHESHESKAEKSEEDEEENEKKRGTSKSSEENMTKDNKDAGSGEKSDAPRHKSKKKFKEDNKVETDKRSALVLHNQHEKPDEKEGKGDEKKRGSRESLVHWAKRGKALKKGDEKEAQQFNSQEEVPHHSKEVSEEEEEKMKRNMHKSPEEKELQTIARRGPEERRGLEEEGSASRRSEEPEIESLATIESELENVAQRLHNLRQG
ncbi:chromogranin-A-like isoform X2 [Antennarius striatus]|uniref:chromogranin-A-like isoform X2 n=1 Tax=Antennarius striatus TaxID=241820 RepID=UPI0035ADC49D